VDTPPIVLSNGDLRLLVAFRFVIEMPRDLNLQQTTVC
jgi:hypothetical protein